LFDLMCRPFASAMFTTLCSRINIYIDIYMYIESLVTYVGVWALSNGND